MMPLFADYRPSRHTAARELRRVQQIGLLPLAIAIALMFIQKKPGPGLWSAAGLTLGLQMILWSAFDLHRTNRALSEWGRALVKTQDRWFPLLVFAAQSLFGIIVLCLIWFSLVELEFSSTWWHQALFGALLVLLPARRLLTEIMRGEYGRAVEVWNELTRQSLIVVLAVGGAALLSSLMVAQAEGYPVEATYLLLIVWIVATLISLSAGVLFFGRIFRRRKVYTVRAKTEPAKPAADAESF